MEVLDGNKGVVKTTLFFDGGNMEKIERPVKISKMDKQVISEKNYKENTDKQLGKIYDKLDELVDANNIPEESTEYSEILWENKSPTSEFQAQSINLKENKYKYFRIFFRTFNSENRIEEKVIRPGDGFDLKTFNSYTPSGTGYMGIYYRNYCSSTQSKITFAECKTIKSNSTTVNTDNTACVPVQVVGFN